MSSPYRRPRTQSTNEPPADIDDDSSAILQLKEVSKSFGPVNVIDRVSINVRPGQVHALLGENGAGKSTLIKMMSGVYQPDSGAIIIDGKQTHLPTSKAAEDLGIATIHQELNLVPTMTVAENVMLGRFPTHYGLVNHRKLDALAQEALDLIGVDVKLNDRIGNLGIARQQMVEIAKALSMHARILILDEPTAALTHHPDEIAEIADTVSVLRDDQLIDEVPATTSEAELVRLMVGREITNQYPRESHPIGAPLLVVKDLSSDDKFQNVSFTVHAGEIVGMAGLVGAGRTEVIRAIAGCDPVTGGTVMVNNHPLKLGDIRHAIRAGIGHVPEDRKAQGLVLGASVNENLGFATLQSTSRFGLADRRGQKQRATKVAKQLRIRMASIDQPVKDLSGGNQQKTVFGRWVLANSQVLLLDEPTRGVDVGAKVEIYQLINSITSAGGAVLMVSSELPEVIGMSDRILVMSGGRLAGELPAGSSQDDIMALAVSHVEDALQDAVLEEITEES